MQFDFMHCAVGQGAIDWIGLDRELIFFYCRSAFSFASLKQDRRRSNQRISGGGEQEGRRREREGGGEAQGGGR